MPDEGEDKLDEAEALLRETLLALRKAKMQVFNKPNKLRLASAVICLETAIDRLRGGE